MGKAALIVAHPGHDLVVYHWVGRHRPLSCCPTDGSGGKARSRLPSTTRLLDALGAPKGAVLGRYPSARSLKARAITRAGGDVKRARPVITAFRSCRRGPEAHFTPRRSRENNASEAL